MFSDGKRTVIRKLCLGTHKEIHKENYTPYMQVPPHIYTKISYQLCIYESQLTCKLASISIEVSRTITFTSCGVDGAMCSVAAVLGEIASCNSSNCFQILIKKSEKPN